MNERTRRTLLRHGGMLGAVPALDVVARPAFYDERGAALYGLYAGLA